MTKICKPHVDQAVEIFERDIRASGLLLSPEDLEYYNSMVAGIRLLAQHNNGAKLLLNKMKHLETKASQADHSNLKEFEEFRRDVARETKDRYVKIAEQIANKIADVESILDARGLRRRKNPHRNHEMTSKRSETSKSVHTENSESKNSVIANPEQDSFQYAYLIKHALTLMGGVVVVLLYNRLSALDKIVHFMEVEKDF